MKNRWAYNLFNAALILALPLVALFVLVKWRRRVFAKGKDRWGERWGRWSPELEARFAQPGRWWWVHAVSMGEVKAIETFLRRSPEAANARILLTAVTPEALTWASEQNVADLVIAAPIDLPWIVRRCMQRVRPQLFISVESEFWPNMLREAKRTGARVALINGRISERSFRSYGRIRFLLNALWEIFDVMAVRQEEDAKRFAALGVEAKKLHVTGNLKYDLLADRRDLHRETVDRAPVVVMGSTREGEENELLPAVQQICSEYPDLRIIWAPRHVERIQEIETLLTSRGLSSERKSRTPQNGTAVAHASHVLWDSMGDLIDAYRQADVAVIGGSFVPKGGQNPIEPAALRVPVLFGPSMENFKGVAESLVQQGGARRVSADTLGDELSALIKNPSARREMGERARHAVESQQGATDRTLTLLLEEVARA